MNIFPPSIAQDDMNRPVIIFKNITNLDKNDEHIVFPIPQSIQFSDSAAYNNSELGFSGSLVLNSIKNSGDQSVIKGAVEQAKAAVPRDLQALAGIAGSNLLGGELRSAVGVATGTTLNKNIVTEFSGVATRQYSFQFKLISNSQQEADIIRNIVSLFRKGMYPKGTSLQLKYPPTWYINFKKDGQDIDYLPKAFETYLTSLSTTYNSSLNLFHKDGSPVETDIQLSFIESRALTLDDIESLERRPFKQGDFSKYSEATASAASLVSSALESVGNIFN